MTLCCRQHKLGGFFGRGDSVPVALADIIPPPFQGSSFWWRLRPRVPLPPSLMRYGVASRGAEFRRPVGAWFRVVDLPPRVPLPPSLMRYGVASHGAEFRRPVGACVFTARFGNCMKFLGNLI